MMTVKERLAKARIDERIARTKWFATLEEFQERATPEGVAEEVWDGVMDGVSHAAGKAVDAIKARPVSAGLAASALALLIFRRPIAGLVKAQFGDQEETGAGLER